MEDIEEMNEQINDLVEEIFYHCDGKDNCSRTVLKVMMEYYGESNEIWHKIAGPFGGGLCGTHTSLCGAVSGGLMVIGLKEDGDEMTSGKELLDLVEAKYGSIYCDKILDIDFDDQEQVDKEKDAKGVSICTPLILDICQSLAKQYAKSEMV